MTLALLRLSFEILFFLGGFILSFEFDLFISGLLIL